MVGRASLNIAEMAGKKMMTMDCDDQEEVEAKLAINLNLGGVSREAILMVILLHLRIFFIPLYYFNSAFIYPFFDILACFQILFDFCYHIVLCFLLF